MRYVWIVNVGGRLLGAFTDRDDAVRVFDNPSPYRSDVGRDLARVALDPERDTEMDFPPGTNTYNVYVGADGQMYNVYLNNGSLSTFDDMDYSGGIITIEADGLMSAIAEAEAQARQLLGLD